MYKYNIKEIRKNGMPVFHAQLWIDEILVEEATHMSYKGAKTWAYTYYYRHKRGVNASK